MEEQNLHEQMTVTSSGTLVHDPQHLQIHEEVSHHNISSKKRPAEIEIDSHKGEGEGENEVKKMKKQVSNSSVVYQYPNPTPEEMASLEALTQTVPDMSTVASSIASLSNQPSPGWAFVVPVPGSSPGGVASPSAVNQQQLYQQILLQHQAWYLQNMQREMQAQLRDDGSKSMPSPSHVFTSAEGNGMFTVLEQPNEVQRKSYKNENRCLLPNPLTVCLKEFLPDDKRGQTPMDGSVGVMLVDQEGEELPGNKGQALESIERSLTQPLDENYTAQFSLKIMETSEGNMVRLLFIVRYKTKQLGYCEEKILSRPFVVYSNRKKQVKAEREKPVLVDLKPTRGEYNKETEVWIKGRGFNDKVDVRFGDKTGRVTDSSENLITVMAPPRDDIIQDSVFEVTVSNKFARELFPADKKLHFTYTTTPTEVRSTLAALVSGSQLESVMMPMMSSGMEEKSVTAELQPSQ